MAGEYTDIYHAQQAAIGHAHIEKGVIGRIAIEGAGETGAQESVADGLYLPLDFVRFPDVVLVGNGDIVARSFGESIKKFPFTPFRRVLRTGRICG